MKIVGKNLKNGRRQFPSNLNLVPFIDLFSMIIIFLIITAVFDRLAALQMNMGTEDKGSVSVPTPEMKKIVAKLKVTLFEDHMMLSDADKNFKLEKTKGVDQKGNEVMQYDLAVLEDFMTKARERNPEKKDIVIFSNDKAPYMDLIKVMDYALGAKFTDLIVTGNR